MSDCLVCRLVEKKANMLFEDENLFAMLSATPATQGHVSIIPKKHAPIFEALPEPVAGDMFKLANKISIAMFEAIGAQGTNLLIRNGVVAGQKQNHTMLHVIPRKENDDLNLTWQPIQAPEEELDLTLQKLMEEKKAEKEEISEDDYRSKFFQRQP